MEPSRKPLNGLWNGFASSLDLHDGTGVTDKKRQRLSGDAVSFDKRINELQGQLIESNERAHTLESFVKQQQLWLEQEREAHAETQDEMTRTQGELARTRLAASELADAHAQECFMYKMQLVILPELEEQVRTMEEQQERQLREETIRLTKEFQGSLIHLTGQMKLEMDKRLASERKRDLESVAQKMTILEDENRDLGAQNMQLAIHRQMADDRAEELQRTLAAVTDDLHAERTVAFDMAHDLHTLEEQLKESNNQLAMVQLNLHETREALGGERDTLRVQLESVNGQLTLVNGQLQTTKSELELCRQELHDAYVEASRLGEELQEEKKQTKAAPVPVNDWRENDGLKLAIKELVDLACQLGDTHAEAPALTEKIGYSQWRAAVSEALRNLGHCGIANWKPHHRLVSGAVTVIGTLMPILYCLFKDAGQKNEKLIASYDKLTAHAKGLEAELDRCKCTDLRAEVVRLRNEIAQTEKEMMEAESLIHQQNGHNQDLSIRVKRRSALESVEVDGRSLLKDLVKVQDQRSQLTKQVEGLERSLAASRTAVEKLQTEKGDLTARLLEAEKQIPPPRALVYVKDLSENVEDLRRSLGPIGEQSCAQCTLYLGKAREAERRRDIAEKSVMEEQRRLVKMTQDSKLFLEAKIKVREPGGGPLTFCLACNLLMWSVPRARCPGEDRRRQEGVSQAEEASGRGRGQTRGGRQDARERGQGQGGRGEGAAEDCRTPTCCQE